MWWGHRRRSPFGLSATASRSQLRLHPRTQIRRLPLQLLRVRRRQLPHRRQHLLQPGHRLTLPRTPLQAWQPQPSLHHHHQRRPIRPRLPPLQPPQRQRQTAQQRLLHGRRPQRLLHRLPRTPTSTSTSTPLPTPTATVKPSGLLGNFQQPTLPLIGNAAPRIRNTLNTIANTPRQRITLVIVLMVTSVLALATFAYLVLRRR